MDYMTNDVQWKHRNKEESYVTFPFLLLALLCYAVSFAWCLVDKLNAWIRLPSIMTIYSESMEMSLDYDPMKIGGKVKD